MSVLEKNIKILKHLRWSLIFFYRNILGRISAEYLAKKLYRKAFKRKLDLENPRTLNEIINYQKFRTDTSMWVDLSDKYKVREYVEAKGLSDILVRLYGVWDKVEDIDFDILPKSFVLKSNNGCATVMIVKDKDKLDIKKTKRVLNKWLKLRFGYRTAEPHYLEIKPRIIAEELLQPSELDKKQSSSIIDYKWYSFNGKTEYARVVTDRVVGTHLFNLSVYNFKWEKYSDFTNPKYKNDKQLLKPQTLDRMIYIANILSEGIPQVRVDLYEVSGKVYFGELTFSTGGGYSKDLTSDFDLLLGDMVDRSLMK
ncbi:MAG: ATP-grasp fold amidoligase family protein [bacterium]